MRSIELVLHMYRLYWREGGGKGFLLTAALDPPLYSQDSPAQLDGHPTILYIDYIEKLPPPPAPLIAHTK